MHVHKRIDLLLLEQELAAAQVPITGIVLLGTDVDDPLEQDVLQGSSTGRPVELPPEATPVVDAHTAPPRVTELAVAVPIEGLLRTTDGAAHELLRFALELQSGYDVEVRVMGVDAANGAVKKLLVNVTMKRLLGGPQAVGAPTTLVSHQDSQASAWAVGFSFSGNDALISVTGAAGRTIDWVCRGSVGRFAPAGL